MKVQPTKRNYPADAANPNAHLIRMHGVAKVMSGMPAAKAWKMIYQKIAAQEFMDRRCLHTAHHPPANLTVIVFLSHKAHDFGSLSN